MSTETLKRHCPSALRKCIALKKGTMSLRKGIALKNGMTLNKRGGAALHALGKGMALKNGLLAAKSAVYKIEFGD